MKRPLAVTITGWFFIAAGTLGLIYHFSELSLKDPLENDAVWVLLVRLLAIAGGVLILLRMNIGRWLLIVWMAYHVVLSYFHTLSEMIMHATFLAVLILVLFHSKSNNFFKGTDPESPDTRR